VIGQTVSHYRIDEKLGEGGVGVVYRAEDLRLKRPVALRFLPSHFDADHRAKDRFLQEARAASGLGHPNICVIYEIDEAEDARLFIAMAYYAGETQGGGRTMLGTNWSRKNRSRIDPDLNGLLTLLLVALAFVSGCAPTFSDLQSARLVGPGRMEITPSYSYVQYSDDDVSDQDQHHVGVQFATGIRSGIDLRLRYEYIDVAGDLDTEVGNWSGIEPNLDGVNVFGIGPKFGLVKDRLAFFVPVGFAFGSDIQTGETVQIQPTLLFSVPFDRHMELTTGAKALLWLDRDNDDLLALNLGLGLSKDLTSWAFRPEVGLLKNPGEDGTFWHFSLGFSFFRGSGEN